MTGISMTILVLASGALIGWLAWGKVKLLRRLDHLSRQYQKAELEKTQLREAFANRAGKEMERFSRLEHDLRSSISVIVGFSSLLREQAEKNQKEQASLVLKGSSAIHQAAEKTLRILDAAVASEQTNQRGAGITLEGRHQVQ
jgi:predicted negative regulator of RcsB-dependent stress response